MSAYGRLNLETLREREARIARERNSRLWGLIAVFLAYGGIFALVGFLIGHRVGYDKGVEAERERVKPRPAVLTPNLILCDHDEFHRICRARERMAKVVAK